MMEIEQLSNSDKCWEHRSLDRNGMVILRKRITGNKARGRPMIA